MQVRPRGSPQMARPTRLNYRLGAREFTEGNRSIRSTPLM